MFFCFLVLAERDVVRSIQTVQSLLIVFSKFSQQTAFIQCIVSCADN